MPSPLAILVSPDEDPSMVATGAFLLNNRTSLKRVPCPLHPVAPFSGHGLRCVQDNRCSHQFASVLRLKRHRLPIRKAGISPLSAILFTVRGLHESNSPAHFASMSNSGVESATNTREAATASSIAGVSAGALSTPTDFGGFGSVVLAGRCSRMLAWASLPRR